MKSPKKYFRLSVLILSLMNLLLTHSSLAKAQNRSRKSRTHTNRKQTSAKKPSPAVVPVKDEQELALNRLFNAATELESSWKNRANIGADGFDTARLSMAADEAMAVIKNELIRDNIGRIATTYKDAMSLYGLAQDRARNPLANSYSTADRERDVEVLKDLKERLYKNRDDPISRDQLRAQINLIETLMRSKYHEQSQEEDPLAKKVRQRKIDARAKEVLQPYGLGEEWPEKELNAIEDVLNVGAKTSALVRDCFKRPDSCSALATEAQEFSEKSARANTQSNTPSNSLVGIWMIEINNPPFQSKFALEVEQQSGSYSGVFGSDKVSDINVSGSSFSFTMRRTRPEGFGVRSEAVTISGSVEGVRMTGKYSVASRWDGEYSVSSPTQTYTFPLTGARLAP